MSKYIYYNKKRKLIGLSLIETIVSMWILGIVIVSMLSFIGASVSKQNQLKIQAMSLAKSELQEAELDVRNQKEHNHYTLLLLKSSYLTEADKNYESNIENDIAENESGFYTKYVSIDGTNWNEIDSTHLEIQSLNKKGAAFSNNSINDEPINLVRPIEKVASNSIRAINGKNLDINSYINVNQLFDSIREIDNKKEQITTQKYPGLENIATDLNIINKYGYGIKCFVMKTTYIIVDTNTTNIKKIPITVEILWSSEKTKNGYHPINAYELQTEVTLIGDPNLSLIK